MQLKVINYGKHNPGELQVCVRELQDFRTPQRNGSVAYWGVSTPRPYRYRYHYGPPSGSYSELPAVWDGQYQMSVRADTIAFTIWHWETPIAWRLCTGIWTVPDVQYSRTTGYLQRNILAVVDSPRRWLSDDHKPIWSDRYLQRYPKHEEPAPISNDLFAPLEREMAC